MSPRRGRRNKKYILLLLLLVLVFFSLFTLLVTFEQHNMDTTDSTVEYTFCLSHSVLVESRHVIQLNLQSNYYIDRKYTISFPFSLQRRKVFFRKRTSRNTFLRIFLVQRKIESEKKNSSTSNLSLTLALFLCNYPKSTL